MAGFRLQLPTIQNWNCHSCSACCREHVIEVTEEERQRIIDQQWSEADGIAADQLVVVRMGGFPWNKRWRLAHQPNGACVFLDEKGLCKIHAKFGEPAKPLPCIIYPYAFHPGGKNVTVSLRFSCPSAVRNRGKAVTDQGKELKKLAAAIVPPEVVNLPAPKITSRQQLDWPAFFRITGALDEALAEPDTPVTVKLLRALFWIDLVDQSNFDIVRGGKLADFLQIITAAAHDAVSGDVSDLGEPSRTGRMQFRMLVAQYARKDTFVDVAAGMRGRWRLFKAAIRFARGKGNVPPLQDVFAPIPFAALESPFGQLSDEAEEILTRYFRVKIQGLHFCGRAYYDLPLVEGFQSLVLVFPAVLWLARWLAAGDGRTTMQTDDVARAVSLADHYHAYSPAFGRGSFRRRVRILAQLNDISKLCAWYSQ